MTKLQDSADIIRPDGTIDYLSDRIGARLNHTHTRTAMYTSKTTTKVIQKPGAVEVPATILAQSIRDLGDAARQLQKSGLKDKTIVLLLSHSSGVNQREVKAVLDAMASLESTYLK